MSRMAGQKSEDNPQKTTGHKKNGDKDLKKWIIGLMNNSKNAINRFGKSKHEKPKLNRKEVD